MRRANLDEECDGTHAAVVVEIAARAIVTRCAREIADELRRNGEAGAWLTETHTEVYATCGGSPDFLKDVLKIQFVKQRPALRPLRIK